jgi:hypothetical protein
VPLFYHDALWLQLSSPEWQLIHATITTNSTVVTLFILKYANLLHPLLFLTPLLPTFTVLLHELLSLIDITIIIAMFLIIVLVSLALVGKPLHARDMRSIDIRHLHFALFFLTAHHVKSRRTVHVATTLTQSCCTCRRRTLVESFLSGCHRSACCLYAFFKA